MDGNTDSWSRASTYEDFMGRWSRRMAPEFVAWLNVAEGVHWLDVGCGTGALTEAISRLAAPASVLGCDPTEAFVRHAREHHGSARTAFVIGGIGALPERADGFGSVTSSFALNFFPDPGLAMDELVHVTRTGGTVSACVWDYAEQMQPLRYFWDAAARTDRQAAALDEGRRFPLCQPRRLETLFRHAGLQEIRCDALDLFLSFADFDEYWRPFLGGTGPAPSYVASLGTDRREALANEIAAMLPRSSDGTISLRARAWAVRGGKR